jgi:hypothetical protein
MDKCPKYQNNGYLDVRLKKEKRKVMNKIAHVFLKIFLNFKKRDMISKSIVELG